MIYQWMGILISNFIRGGTKSALVENTLVCEILTKSGILSQGVERILRVVKFFCENLFIFV